MTSKHRELKPEPESYTTFFCVGKIVAWSWMTKLMWFPTLVNFQAGLFILHFNVLVLRKNYPALTKFPKKLMIWQAICSCSRRSKTYVAKGTMNAATYHKECLQQRLLPFLRSHNVPPLFWPDLASIHYSKSVVQWYLANEVNFVPMNANLPNRPHLRPIETYWAIIKQKLRKAIRKPLMHKVFKNYGSGQLKPLMEVL